MIEFNCLFYYIIWYQKRKMAGRGRGRAGLAQMRRDMQNLERRVAKHKNALVYQRIIPRDASDEETKHRNVDHQREQEEQLEHMPFEEWLFRALEGINDGIKIEVPDYAGNLKPEELIDWLNSVANFFEWKSMIQEKKVKFACTKLKGHATFWWDHIQKDRPKKGKEKL
jgi:hypothetical protein